MKNFYSFLFYLLICCLLYSSQSFTQDLDTLSENTDDVLENFLEDTDTENEDYSLFDNIEELVQNPIDINLAELNSLLSIPYINLTTANSIINHRKKFGDFYSTRELFSVQGLDQEIVYKILPFVKVDIKKIEENIKEGQTIPKESSVDKQRRKIKFQNRSRMQNDLQLRKGFIEDKFEGSKPKIYSRSILTYNKNFSLNLLSEKDAGEKSLDDFTSYSFLIKDFNFIKDFVIGDYNIEFGQGLTMWNPYSFKKGGIAILPSAKFNTNIKSHRSAEENKFYRGTAIAIRRKPFDITFFYSKNKFDANIDSLTNEITSTPIDGLHRTENELFKKNLGEEKVLGGILNYQFRNKLYLGFLYYQSDFNQPFQKENIFDISGSQFKYYSFTYNYFVRNILFSGEFSYNNTSVALINSVQFAFSKNLSLITSIRNYPKNFFSLHGSAFSESAEDAQNEFGIYTGIMWKSPFGLINFYYDYFKFPYATFNNPLPSSGNEFLFNLESKISKSVSTNFRYKNENKEIALNTIENKIISDRLKQNFRGELILDINKNLRLKSRIEINRFKIEFDKSQENGFLTYQDIRYNLTKNFIIYGRVIFFKTDSFNSAIYEYENDLLGVLTNIPMYGEGMRYYVMLKYKFQNIINLSIKYSETSKPREKVLSSGDSEIFNNVDNRLNLQVDINF